MNLHVTNPEFMERFEYFAYEEAVQEKGQELPFLRVVNEILEERGISLPGQSTTTLEERLEKGVEAQAEIFGSLNTIACVNKAAQE
ncbi:MAG: hypothetical protein HFG51_05555 [Lachnospiraceae bacterium]|nr:hypothetical protein [Lachnospiraceae bacterium]